MKVTHHRLLSLLRYNRRTGLFRWLIATNGRIKVGQIAGTIGKDGYVIIQIDGVSYRAQINRNGRTTHIGYYDTAAQASAAYKREAIHLFGEFANP